MLATERVFEIEEAFGEKVQSLVPLELDGETLRLILYLKDGTNLRLTEQWHLQPSFETCLEEVMEVVLSSEEGG